MTDTGPLAGLRVVELGAIGPVPLAAMILADLGADVVRIDRPSGGLRLGPPDAPDPTLRGRRRVAADLKAADGRETVLRLADRADVLLDGFRPGVTERLGIGPDDCQQRNPRLVYARMTGWGQDGPLAQRAAEELPGQMDREHWPELKARFTNIFAARPRDEWVKIFADTDACVTPVLAFAEVPQHPQVAARNTVVRQDGVLQAAPAPRFSRTPAKVPATRPDVEDINQVLADWGQR
jgi:crotonobetainyl-CoA:carnitine CoA-transferase CaiB-like acyl-CoA transferase